MTGGRDRAAARFDFLFGLRIFLLFQHSILLERCSLILADAESARVKSDEQDNHFPPLTALDREGAWLRKISKRHLVM